MFFHLKPDLITPKLMRTKRRLGLCSKQITIWSFIIKVHNQKRKDRLMKQLIEKSGVKKLLFVCVATASLLFTTSCGKKPEQDIVKDVNIQTELRGNDVWLSLGAVFKLGALSMTAISLPVVDPNDPSIQYGEIGFKPMAEEGYNEVVLSFNLSASSKVEGSSATLPNGAALPIAGLDNSNVLELKIASINSSIYLSFTENMSVLGFAISIKEFEKVGAAINGANVFLGFDIKGVLGSVGLFTGDEPLKNGLAFFVDLSSVINGQILDDLIAGRELTPAQFTEMTRRANTESKQSRGKRKSNYLDVNKTPKNLLKIYKEVNKMGPSKLHFIKD